MKYRIVEKNELYYPQYKMWGFWWNISYPNGLKITCMFLGEAKEVIQKHKRKRKCKKPIIHYVE